MSNQKIAKTLFVGLVAIAGWVGCSTSAGQDSSVTDQAVLDPPTGVAATATSSTRVTVTWDAVPGATLYYIYRSDSGGPFTGIAAVHAPETSFDAAGLTANTTYSFAVASYDPADGQQSALSAPATVTTPDETGGLTPPTGVTAAAISSSRILVTWNPVPAATLYYIYRSDAGGPFNAIAATPDTTFESAGLSGSTQYCYEIQSFNPSGTSVLSTPPACASTGANGLSARWKFDDRSGSVAADSSGSGLTGFLQGAAAFNTVDRAPLIDENQHNPSSLSAPGGAGDFVSVADGGAFSFTGNDFTVSLWVNAPATGLVHLIGKRAAGCGATNWEIGSSGGLFFFRGIATTSFGSLPANTWTQVAVTSSGGDLTFYVNGRIVGFSTIPPGPATADPLQIGNAGGCGNASAVLIDETRIFSTALTAAEIAALGTRPPAPAGLTGTVLSSTHVDLNWSAVASAELYIMYRGSAAGNEQFLTTAPPSSTVYHEGHLTPGQTTSWQVRSVVNGLLSEFSNEVVLRSNDPPAAPGGVTATATSQSQIDVSWTAQPVATVYYVFLGTGGGPLTAVGAITAPNTLFTVAGLTAGTTYQLAVASMDSGGTIGDPSAPVTATTQP